MSGLLSRRELLSRRSESRVPSGPRPPWSVPDFQQACDGCAECIPACSEHILVKDSAGLPAIDFARGGCTFCGDCLDACQGRADRAPALARPQGEGAARLPLLARLGAACISIQGVACRLCGDPCGDGAIRFRPLTGGRALPEISEVSCTGCGICVSACPVGALSMVPVAAAPLAQA